MSLQGGKAPDASLRALQDEADQVNRDVEEGVRRRGRPRLPEDEKNRPITISMDPNTIVALRNEAVHRGLSQGELITKMFRMLAQPPTEADDRGYLEQYVELTMTDDQRSLALELTKAAIGTAREAVNAYQIVDLYQEIAREIVRRQIKA